MKLFMTTPARNNVIVRPTTRNVSRAILKGRPLETFLRRVFSAKMKTNPENAVTINFKITKKGRFVMQYYSLY